MKKILVAAQPLKTAIVEYFSENVEIKINRSFAVMCILIPVGSFIAWWVNNK